MSQQSTSSCPGSQYVNLTFIQFIKGHLKQSMKFIFRSYFIHNPESLVVVFQLYFVKSYNPVSNCLEFSKGCLMQLGISSPLPFSHISLMLFTCSLFKMGNGLEKSTLLRLLPRSKVSEGDEAWAILKDLKEIVQLVLS